MSSTTVRGTTSNADVIRDVSPTLAGIGDDVIIGHVAFCCVVDNGSIYRAMDCFSS